MKKILDFEYVLSNGDILNFSKLSHLDTMKEFLELCLAYQEGETQSQLIGRLDKIATDLGFG